MASFKVLGINHIGIAAKDPDKTAHFLSTILGVPHLADELVKTQMTMTRMYASKNHQEDHDPRLEILINEAGREGPITKFLAKKGGGIHHIALTVDHIENAIAALRLNGVRMIDETPRNGAHHTRIAFVHPESVGGILFELVQESES